MLLVLAITLTFLNSFQAINSSDSNPTIPIKYTLYQNSAFDA